MAQNSSATNGRLSEPTNPWERSSEDTVARMVLDNLAAHKAPPVTKRLADPKRDRWHLHFTPTSSSWLNLLERWFGELTERRLRRGVFTSVPDLVNATETWPRPGVTYPSHIRDAPPVCPMARMFRLEPEHSSPFYS